MPCIRFRGEGEETIVPITSEKTVIGRTSRCDVVLEDTKVSRQHCRIVWEGESFFIEDLRSRCGTLVNSIRLTEKRPLAEGDVITVGTTDLTFTADQEDSQARTFVLEPSGSKKRSSTVQKKSTTRRRRKTEVAEKGEEAGGNSLHVLELPGAEASEAPRLDFENEEEAAPPEGRDDGGDKESDADGDRKKTEGERRRSTDGPPVASPRAGGPPEGEGQLEFTLTRIDSGAERMSFLLTRDEVTVGRTRENVIRIKDDSISGKHALLRRRGNDWSLEDLGSTNGTRVNGNKVKQAKLRISDEIRFGNVRFQLEARGGRPSLPQGEEQATETFDSQAVAEKLLESESEELSRQLASERVRAAGGAGGLVAAVVVLCLAAIAVGLLARWGSQPSGVGEIAGVKGNLIADFSFENEPGGWRLEAGQRVASTGPTRSGQRSLEVNEKGGSAREVLCKQIFAVRPGRTHRLAGWIHARASRGVAGLRIAWLAGDEVVAEDHTGMVTGPAGEWTQVEGSFVPPARADRFTVAAFTAGATGAVRFDNVTLVVGDTAGATAPDYLSLGEHEIRWDRRGILQLRSGDQTPIHRIRLISGSLESPEFDQGLGRTRPGFPRELQDGVVLGGEIFQLRRGRWFPFTTEIRRRAEGFRLRVSLPVESLGDTGTLTLLIEPDVSYLSSGLGIVTPSEAQILRRPATIRNLLQATLKRDTQLVGFQVARQAAMSYRVHGRSRVLAVTSVAPGDSGEHTFEFLLRTSMTSQTTRLDSLLARALRSEKEGREGRALLAYQEILRSFPFSRETHRIKVFLQRIGERHRALVSALTDRMTRAGFFGRADRYGRVEREARASLVRYTGSALAAPLEKIRDEAASRRRELEAAGRAGILARLAFRARDMGMSARPGLALLIVREALAVASDPAERARFHALEGSLRKTLEVGAQLAGKPADQRCARLLEESTRQLDASKVLEAAFAAAGAASTAETPELSIASRKALQGTRKAAAARVAAFATAFEMADGARTASGELDARALLAALRKRAVASGPDREVLSILARIFLLEFPAHPAAAEARRLLRSS